MAPPTLNLGVLKHSRRRPSEYQLLVDDNHDAAEVSQPTPARVQFATPLETPQKQQHMVYRRRNNNRSFVAVFLACCAVCGVLAIGGMLPGMRGGSGISGSSNSVPSHGHSRPKCYGDDCPDDDEGIDVPDYFQTKPEFWPGPTQTGAPAFMAQTASFAPTGTGSFVPTQPLQTAMPIHGMQAGNASIFDRMGYLTPYRPSTGFGVNEYPLPPDAEIIQVHMLSRHGARYPTADASLDDLARKLQDAGENSRFKGPLAFLNNWTYRLGREILVPKGRQELFDSGVLHSYLYSSLYDPNTKIIARTTHQDRMLKSAEYFLAGFFGLDWTQNATIEAIIDHPGFNNSLAGYMACPNAEKAVAGKNASEEWSGTYLRDAATRLGNFANDLEFTTNDAFLMQMMCSYETVTFGLSKFCDLFTYDEWLGFGYAIDLLFAGTSGFQSPVGRATGLGYQQEVLARLRNHTLGYSGSNINVTLDSDEATFPLNQTLYFDFTHDSNLLSVLTAFGLRQFAKPLPVDRRPDDRDHDLDISNITPFAARLDIEIIRSPRPVRKDRNDGNQGSGSVYEQDGGGETKYIHFVLNQRTVPLGRSLPECDPDRVDGWCELETFLRVQDQMQARAQFDYACFGDWQLPAVWGEVNDGVPSIENQ